MSHMISTEEKLECVERELKMRQRVYRRFVEQGKMSEAKAALEIRLMQSIVHDYEELVKKERLL